MKTKYVVILVSAACVVSVVVTVLVMNAERGRPREDGAPSLVGEESYRPQPTQEAIGPNSIDMKALFEEYDVVKAGRYLEAIEAYKKAMRSQPPYTGGPAPGDYYAKTGKYQEAIAVSEERAADGPDILYTIAWVQAKLGRYDDAILTCKRTTEAYPDYSKIWHVFAWVYARQDEADKAVEACEQAIKLEPDSAQVHYAVGRIYAATGESEKAIEAYKEAIRLKNDYAPAYLFMGVTYAELGNKDEAMRAYRDAILYDKHSPEAHFFLGAAYEQAGRYADAIAELEEAAKLYYYPESEARMLEMGLRPDMAGLYCTIGACHLRLGEFFKAKLAFENAVKINPDHPGAHFGLGLSYLCLGDRKNALAEYQTVKSLQEGPMSKALGDIIDKQGQ